MKSKHQPVHGVLIIFTEAETLLDACSSPAGEKKAWVPSYRR
jgi:hypothetical protein